MDYDRRLVIKIDKESELHIIYHRYAGFSFYFKFRNDSDFEEIRTNDINDEQAKEIVKFINDWTY